MSTQQKERKDMKRIIIYITFSMSTLFLVHCEDNRATRRTTDSAPNKPKEDNLNGDAVYYLINESSNTVTKNAQAMSGPSVSDVFFSAYDSNTNKDQIIGIYSPLCYTYQNNTTSYSLVLTQSSNTDNGFASTLSMSVKDSGVVIYEDVYNSNYTAKKTINEKIINGLCNNGVLTLENNQGTVIYNAETIMYRDGHGNVYVGLQNGIHQPSSTTDVSMRTVTNGVSSRAIFRLISSKLGTKTSGGSSNDPSAVYEVFDGHISIESDSSLVVNFVNNDQGTLGTYFFAAPCVSTDVYIGTFKYISNKAVVILSKPQNCRNSTVANYVSCTGSKVFLLGSLY